LHNILGRAQLNQRLHSGTGGNFIQRALPNPQGLVASVTYWAIFLFAVSIAVSYLGIPALSQMIEGVYDYIPNVIAAILIFLVAGTVSGAVATLVANAMGDTPTGKAIGTAVPVVIMSIATFMILNQLKIAPAIVTITYATLLGSAGLAMALAFGLGGRDVAGAGCLAIFTTRARQLRAVPRPICAPVPAVPKTRHGTYRTALKFKARATCAGFFCKENTMIACTKNRRQ
jgi:hypothetical protein